MSSRYVVAHLPPERLSAYLDRPVPVPRRHREPWAVSQGLSPAMEAAIVETLERARLDPWVPKARAPR